MLANRSYESSRLTKRLCEVAKPDIKWITEIPVLGYEILPEVTEDIVIVIVNLENILLNLTACGCVHSVRTYPVIFLHRIILVSLSLSHGLLQCEGPPLPVA